MTWRTADGWEIGAMYSLIYDLEFYIDSNGAVTCFPRNEVNSVFRSKFKTQEEAMQQIQLAFK